MSPPDCGEIDLALPKPFLIAELPPPLPQAAAPGFLHRAPEEMQPVGIPFVLGVSAFAALFCSIILFDTNDQISHAIHLQRDGYNPAHISYPNLHQRPAPTASPHAPE